MITENKMHHIITKEFPEKYCMSIKTNSAKNTIFTKVTKFHKIHSFVYVNSNNSETLFYKIEMNNGYSPVKDLGALNYNEMMSLSNIIANLLYCLKSCRYLEKDINTHLRYTDIIDRWTCHKDLYELVAINDESTILYIQKQQFFAYMIFPTDTNAIECITPSLDSDNTITAISHKLFKEYKKNKDKLAIAPGSLYYDKDKCVYYVYTNKEFVELIRFNNNDDNISESDNSILPTENKSLFSDPMIVKE